DDYYTFELMGISIENGDTIYQIAFAETVVPPPPKHPSGRTYLKINGTDLAIIEVQFTRDSKIQALQSQTRVKFEKVNGKYYPKYIHVIQPRNINRNFEDDEFDIQTM